MPLPDAPPAHETGIAVVSAFTPTGLILPADLTFKAWEDIGHQLCGIEQARQWWIGDWINYGERRYGEKYAQALDVTGLALSTLQSCAYVAGRVELAARRQLVPWSLHAEVAKLEPAEREAILDRVEAEGMSRAALRLALKAADESPDEPLYGFTVELRILHSAVDAPHAEAWVRRLGERLSSQGALVTKTKIRWP
jgi:hypothetical protein